MIRRRLEHLAFATSAAVLLGLQPSLAQEAPVCSFICKVTGQAGEQAVAPPPAPQPGPAVEAAAATPSALKSGAKPKAKPRLVPVSIAAGEPEAAATRALAAGLKAHTVRVVAAAAQPADLVVAPRAEAGSSRAGAPLFREELHVVGLAELKSLADLQGRSVSLGPDGSPTQAIARKILAARHIAIKEVPLDLDNALDGLATGDLDAVALFAPQPFNRLNDLPGGGRLHLLTAASSADDDPALAPALISAAGYPALSSAATPTLSIGVHVTTSAHAAHPREAAAVVAALAAKARKTLAAQPSADMRSVAVSR